jgi:hypothetical protein
VEPLRSEGCVIASPRGTPHETPPTPPTRSDPSSLCSLLTCFQLRWQSTSRRAGFSRGVNRRKQFDTGPFPPTLWLCPTTAPLYRTWCRRLTTPTIVGRVRPRFPRARWLTAARPAMGWPSLLVISPPTTTTSSLFRGGEGTRTLDLRHAKPPLFQLSYTPVLRSEPEAATADTETGRRNVMIGRSSHEPRLPCPIGA